MTTAIDNTGSLIVSRSANIGEKGDTGAAGLGFDLAHKVDLDNPLVHLFKTNDIDNTLNSTLTWTRASTATYIDRYGVVKTAAIDTPREEKEGFLIEGASTNLCLHSENFSNAAWTKFNATVAANVATAPDGTTTADRVTLTGGITILRQSVVIPTGSTFSVWVQVESGSLTALTIDHGDGVSVSIMSQLSSSGMVRVSAVGLAKGAGAYVDITLQGTVNATVLIWGAQFEELPFATSYIPTTTTAVTRAADLVSCAGENNAPLLSSNNTVACNFSRLGHVTAYSALVWAMVADDIFNKSLQCWNGNPLSVTAYTSGVSRGAFVPSTKEVSSVAIVYDSTIVRPYIDGVAGTTAVTPYTDPNVATIIHFGNVSGSVSSFVHIKDFRVYDFALTQDQITHLYGA